jgi:hypothetical protein
MPFPYHIATVTPSVYIWTEREKKRLRFAEYRLRTQVLAGARSSDEKKKIKRENKKRN